MFHWLGWIIISVINARTYTQARKNVLKYSMSLHDIHFDRQAQVAWCLHSMNPHISPLMLLKDGNCEMYLRMPRAALSSRASWTKHFKTVHGLVPYPGRLPMKLTWTMILYGAHVRRTHSKVRMLIIMCLASSCLHYLSLRGKETEAECIYKDTSTIRLMLYIKQQSY